MSCHLISSCRQITPEIAAFIDISSQEDNQTDFRHFLSNDFLQRTAGKRRQINKFRDMGFFLKIPIYQTCEGFAEKVNGLGDFLGCSGHVFQKCGQLRNLAEFLLEILIYLNNKFCCQQKVGGLCRGKRNVIL